MQSSKQKSATKSMKSVTYLSIVTNIGLAAVKLVVGLLTGSLAFVAGAIHSLSDLATDGAVLVGFYFGSKKPDQSHPYGHGRLETFAAAAVAIVLVVVGGGVIYNATRSIASDPGTSL